MLDNRTPAEISAASVEAMKRIRMFEHEFKEKTKEFDNGLDAARTLSREAIYKILFISASIVGFSATIQSITGLNIDTDSSLLKLSWILFLAVIVVGPLMNIIEGRIKYLIVWRGLQMQELDWKDELDLWQKFQAVMVILYSLLVSPRNLLFCRIYKSKARQKLRARQNGFVIAKSNLFINFILFLEIVFVVLFIAALVILIQSIKGLR